MFETLVAVFVLATVRPEAVAPLGVYDLTITAETGAHTQTTLTCKPRGGSHPQGRQSCVQLVPVDGDIAAIPPADGVCTMEYAPVTVRATGSWDGTDIKFEKVFSNRCVANLQTGGHVFNF